MSERMIPLHVADQAVAAVEAELAKVKAEVERLRKGDERDMTAAYLYAAEQYKAENARLKAEVERLTKQNALATPRSLIASQDIKTLREQVERLTKAGDAMAEDLIGEFGSYNSVYAWHAAKEGKQS